MKKRSGQTGAQWPLYLTLLFIVGLFLLPPALRGDWPGLLKRAAFAAAFCILWGAGAWAEARLKGRRRG